MATSVKLHQFVLIFLLAAALIISYFVVVSKYKIITSNANKYAQITDAALVSIQNAQNLTSTSYVVPHESMEDTYNKHTIPVAKIQGKVLVTLYKEQQIGAAMSMFSLQKWAKIVGAAVVEPFVQNSTFTLPIVNSQQELANHLRFRDYFNFDIWTNMSIAKNVTPLVSWDTFINQVPQQFIFVMLLKCSRKEERSVYVNSEIVQQAICNATFASFMKNYDFYINHFFKIKLVRTVCLSFYKTVMHIDNFTSVIYGNFNSSDTMVWFYRWKGFAKTNRARVLQEPFHRSPEILDMLHTSKKISDDGKNYINKILRSEPGNYMAISIRTVLRAKHTPTINHTSFFHNCIAKLEHFINSISIFNQTLFMSMDLGRFGDVDANSYISEELMHYIKTRIFQIVYNNSLTMEQWEQSFVQATNGITDNGYIAAMQRTILENSKCLVMFGGGSNFQRNLLLSYKERHTNESCLYEVCYEK